MVPILRAGLVLLEQAATVLPNSQTMHVGYVRNEETLEVSLPGALPAHAAGCLFNATALACSEDTPCRSRWHIKVSLKARKIYRPCRCCLQATSYLNKLPDRLAADDRILVVDPMLATGKLQPILPQLPSRQQAGHSEQD